MMNPEDTPKFARRGIQDLARKSCTLPSPLVELRSTKPKAGLDDCGGMALRNDFLLHGISKDKVGVEIGPFYSPIASKRQGYNVIVVDFADAVYLRNLARTHSSETIRNLVHLIEDVDAVWKGEPLDQLCASIDRHKIDYIIASHVVEHIPDLISFFQSAANMLNDGGHLNLAMPDLRACFDRLKAPSRTADALRAYREKRTLHAPETVYSAHADQTHVDGTGAWLRSDVVNLYFPDELQAAYREYLRYDAALRDGTQTYKDVHAWITTPSSFSLMITELQALNLIQFRIEELLTTNNSEYLVRLKKTNVTVPTNELNAERIRLHLKHEEEMAELNVGERESNLTSLVKSRDDYIDALRAHISHLEKASEDYQSYIRNIESRLAAHEAESSAKLSHNPF